MELFWKTSAAIPVALILILSLSKQERDMGTLLAIAVCCMTGIAALKLLEPVLDFIYEIQLLAPGNETILKILLQIVGIGLVSELLAMICSDAGNASLGKGVQFLASSAILYRSLPVIESMLTLIREIMGGI